MIGLALSALPQRLVAEVVGVAIEAVLVAGLVWHYTSAHYELKAKAETAAQVQANLAQSERNRALEAQLSKAKQDVLDANASAQKSVASVAASFRADSDGLRHALAAAYSSPAGDSLAACEQRSARAGDLLAESMRVQIDLASSAESLAADARSVRDFAAQQKALMP